jgi:hypothetical protein
MQPSPAFTPTSAPSASSRQQFYSVPLPFSDRSASAAPDAAPVRPPYSLPKTTSSPHSTFVSTSAYPPNTYTSVLYHDLPEEKASRKRKHLEYTDLHPVMHTPPTVPPTLTAIPTVIPLPTATPPTPTLPATPSPAPSPTPTSSSTPTMNSEKVPLSTSSACAYHRRSLQ